MIAGDPEMKHGNLADLRTSHFAGTPSTGKSTLCAEVCQQCELEWINVGEVAKQNKLYSGFDEQYNCPVLDEDQV